MDINERKQSSNDFSLRKDEILNGHNAYSKVLQNSISISTGLLKAFISLEKTNSDSFEKSPLFTNKVKVGFIIAKKKIKKSVIRNRIRRLLKESYRLSRNQSGISSLNLTVIFSLTELGYNYFINYPKTKFEIIERDMKRILEKIKIKFSKK